MNKLRIANYSDHRISGRDDGNSKYMRRAFQRTEGIDSVYIHPFGDLTKFGTFDLHFEADWGEDALKGFIPYEVSKIPHPNVFWASDTHISPESYQWRLNHARHFDTVFCAQQKAVDNFRRDGIKNVHWMPHAVEPLAYPKQTTIKKYDVCFVGHINSENRIDALDRLFRVFPNFWYGQRTFEEAAEKFGESKIVFNISITDDLNMRTFEGMATGSLLLTSRNAEVESVFEDGRHLVLYDNLDDMIDKARYYVEHEEERERIACAGYEEVMAKHTFEHRVKQVLETCGLLDKLKGSEEKELAVTD